MSRGSALGLSPGNAMNRAVLSLLIFEVIVFWLGFPGMVQIDGVGVGFAIGAVTLASVLAIAAAILLKTRWGYPLGWLTQIVGVLLGFLTPMMFAAAGLFAVLWVVCVVLGKKMERNPRPES